MSASRVEVDGNLADDEANAGRNNQYFPEMFKIAAFKEFHNKVTSRLRLEEYLY